VKQQEERVNMTIRARDYLPRHVIATTDPNNNEPTTFEFERILGEGGEGVAALYISSDRVRVTVKVQYCNETDPAQKGEDEANLAAQASAAIGSTCTPKGCPGCTVKSNAIRVPMSTVKSGPCSFSIYPFFHFNLSDWIAENPKRSPEMIISLFEQALGIIICLRDKGYYYSDIKSSNFLVVQNDSSDLTPQLIVGDLGGIVTENSKSVQLPTERLPPILLKDFSWKKMDQITSFLLATLALELVLRVPLASDDSSPLDSFFSCLQETATETVDPDKCVENVMRQLKGNLASGLSLHSPLVQSIVATALNLMGYRKMYVKLSKIAGLIGTY
jgi:hypothetical protein